MAPPAKKQQTAGAAVPLPSCALPAAVHPPHGGVGGVVEQAAARIRNDKKANQSL